MKTKTHTGTRLALAATLLAGLALALTSAQAQMTLYWQGTGDWDTTSVLWGTSTGNIDEVAWTQGYNATFEGVVGTVTLTEAITANDITFTSPGSNYLIEGNTLDLTGGSITMAVKNQKHTITSAIAGNPDVNIINGTGYEGLTFAPTSGTVALGTCTVPYDDPVGGDKAGLRLGGSTTGNTVSEVTYEGGDKYGAIYVQDTGEWTFGNVLVGIVYVQGGDMIANGEISTTYAGLLLQSGTLHYNNVGAVKSGAFKFQGGSLDNTSGAAITTSDYNPASSWEGNWTFLGSNGANSDLNLGTGTVTLTGTRTVTVQNAATTLTIDGVVTDSTSVYGLAKAGDGTLKLTNANTYNGTTTVSAGTLSLGDGTNNSNLDDDAILEIDGTGTLNLNFTAGNVDTVFALTFDDALQATGTWGRTGHPTADYTTSKITGDGLINNLGGAAPAGTNYWDGSLVGGTGNGASNGGSGIWSTSNANWDVGLGSRVAWPDTNADKAIFRAAAGTVELGSDITLNEILIDGVDNYSIGANPEDNSLNFDGTDPKITVDGQHAVIRAGITGSPELIGGAGFRKIVQLIPASADMTLGQITYGAGSTSNPEIHLRGTTHGNSTTSVQSPFTYSFLRKKDSGTWTVGGVTIGVVYLEAGTLIANGTWNIGWSDFKFQGGTLGGTGTINESITVPNNGGLTFDLSTDAASHDKLEIGGGTNKLAFAGASELTITSSGGASPGVYTLVSGVGNITGSAPATVNLPADWAATVSISGADLLLTVTSTGAGGNDYSDWIAGYPGVGGQTGFNDDPDGDTNSNGLENFFGTDPTASSAGLSAGVKNGSTFTFTHPQNPTPASDITAAYRWSTNLNDYYADGASFGGTTVNFSATPDNPVPGTTTVMATITGTVPDKLFADVEVTLN